MATPKTITAYNISTNQDIVISQLPEGIIRFSQCYQFLDNNGAAMPILGVHENAVDIAFTALPQSIRDSLIAIRDYLQNKALTTEGMI